MTDKTGYEDPWRPFKKPDPTGEEPQGSGMTGTMESADPMDADLIPHKECVLRVPGGANELLIYGAVTQVGAVKVMLAQIRSSDMLSTFLAKEGFVVEPYDEAPPQGWYLTDKEWRLRHPEARDSKDGFNRLVMALRRGVRYVPGFRDTLKRVGIFPLHQ
jgi:hypothetical protein